MANPHRGEVSFEADGKTWTMVFTTNAICELEAETGESIHAFGSKLDAPSMKMVRVMVWAALRPRHPEITIEAAGDIMDAIGVEKAGNLVSRAMSLLFTEAKGKPGPRKAGRAGSG
jgi:hypothetical protein